MVGAVSTEPRTFTGTAKGGLVELVALMLSSEERRALVLRHTRHLGDSQIARQLGCTRAAAVSLLAKAEAKVRAAQRALIEAFVETNAGRVPPVKPRSQSRKPREALVR